MARLPIPPKLRGLDTREVRAYLETLRDDLTTDHGELDGLLDDDHTQYPYITSQAGAPTSTPNRVGLINIDTTNDKVYIAVDTSSSSDWLDVSGAGSGDGDGTVRSWFKI